MLKHPLQLRCRNAAVHSHRHHPGSSRARIRAHLFLVHFAHCLLSPLCWVLCATMEVAGGGTSVHEFAVFLRWKSRSVNFPLRRQTPSRRHDAWTREKPAAEQGFWFLTKVTLQPPETRPPTHDNWVTGCSGRVHALGGVDTTNHQKGY